MDVDLLSKMLKELILDNDIVTLPGMGAFIAEVVPSAFSDRGYTINPPYRKLYFRSRADEDKLLVSLYASSNGIDIKTAEKLLLEFTSELKEHLFSHKNVILPGLGRLRATKENDIFFIPDEDLDIYPSGFGLQPISLKTHQETPEEVTAAVESLKSIIIEDKKDASTNAVAEAAEVAVAEAAVDVETETAAMEEAVVVDAIGSGEDSENVGNGEVGEVVGTTEAAVEVETETAAMEGAVAVEAVGNGKDSENVGNGEVDEDSENGEVGEATGTNEVAIETEIAVVEEPVQETIEEVTEEEIEEVAVEESEEDTETIQKQSEVGNKFALNPVIKKILITLAIAAGAVVLFIGIFLALAHICPEFIDSILYTEEELRILNGTL